jgi:methionyl-tRNA synthetase
MEKRYYATTPIYYVNAEPHIGHAYTTIVADFVKRVYTLRGYDTYFLTGTDEHGDKIQKAAEENNSTPQEYTDKISALFRETWSRMNIQNDDFIRTTEERHTTVVKSVLQKVYDNGDIYFDSYGGHYCVGCERFLPEKDLVDGKCPIHKKKPQWIEEKNYFFRMKKYQSWLSDHIKENPDFIRPDRYKNEVLSLLNNEELEDLCISRPKSRLTWGIPLPFDENYVTYVWFDALINYISALGYPEGELFEKYWKQSNHFIAKDILKPHGIFWPTMLKAAGIEPYTHLNVHGYWNMGEAKMSKSLGNVVRPDDLIRVYGNDQIRFFLLREMNFGQDAKFTEEAVTKRINFDLANDYGNLINRTFNMAAKYFNSKVPERMDNADKVTIGENLKRIIAAYFAAVDTCAFSNGIESLWEFVRSINKYIEDTKPWVLAKDENKDQLATVMRNLLESIYAIAVLISPVCFLTSPKIIKSLTGSEVYPDIETLADLSSLETGFALENPGILFPRYEKTESENNEKQTPQKKDKSKSTKESSDAKKESDENLLDIKEFFKTDLRVAKILEAEKIDGSDKLLRLQINTGIDKRQIVAGIAQKYSAEEIIGKKIIVVANLKPAKIFKNESNGMLLAAKKDKDDLPTVVFVDDSIEEGSKLG